MTHNTLFASISVLLLLVSLIFIFVFTSLKENSELKQLKQQKQQKHDAKISMCNEDPHLFECQLMLKEAERRELELKQKQELEKKEEAHKQEVEKIRAERGKTTGEGITDAAAIAGAAYGLKKMFEMMD